MAEREAWFVARVDGEVGDGFDLPRLLLLLLVRSTAELAGEPLPPREELSLVCAWVPAAARGEGGVTATAVGPKARVPVSRVSSAHAPFRAIVKPRPQATRTMRSSLRTASSCGTFHMREPQ